MNENSDPTAERRDEVVKRMLATKPQPRTSPPKKAKANEQDSPKRD